MGNSTRTRNRFHKLSLAACLSAFAATALGQEDRAAASTRKLESFGEGSRWVVALEGLAGLAYEPGPDQKTTAPDENGVPRSATSKNSFTTFTVLRPAVGVDVFVLPHVSFGLGATYDQSRFRQTIRYEGLRGLGPDLDHLSTQRRVTLRPRIGVAYAWESGFGVWGRAEARISQGWMKSESSSMPEPMESSGGGLGVGVQALGTYTPTDHVVFMAGPSLAKTVALWSDPDPPFPTPDASDYPVAVAFSVGGGVYF